MSDITDIIILVPHGEQGMQDINIWLRSFDFNPMVDISENAGGSKVLQSQIWSCALNHFTKKQELAKLFDSLPWTYPGLTILLMKQQDDDTWMIVKLGEL